MRETQKGKILRGNEVPASHVARRASAIRAKLMQRHAADILESRRIYSRACNAMTIEWIHYLYSASRVCIYMNLGILRVRSPSTKISNHRFVSRESSTTAKMAICVPRIISWDGHRVNERET